MPILAANCDHRPAPHPAALTGCDFFVQMRRLIVYTRVGDLYLYVVGCGPLVDELVLSELLSSFVAVMLPCSPASARRPAPRLVRQIIFTRERGTRLRVRSRDECDSDVVACRFCEI